MRFEFRFIAACITFLAGTILSVVYCWKGHWLGGIGYCWTGMLAFILVLFGYSVIEEWWYQLASGLLLLFSIFAVTQESPAINIDLTKAQNDLLLITVEFASQSHVGFDQREIELIDSARIVCALQPIADNKQLAADLMKAQKLGPITSLLDGIWSNSSDKKQPKRCLDYYVELRKTKPSLFTTFGQNNPWVLTYLGSN